MQTTQESQRITELEAELAALREVHNDLLQANYELWQDIDRLKAELAKHTALAVIGSRHKEGGLVIPEAPEKHPFDSGLVVVRPQVYPVVSAWRESRYYREFISHFQDAGYLVKPAQEVAISPASKDMFVKNAWKPL